MPGPSRSDAVRSGTIPSDHPQPETVRLPVPSGTDAASPPEVRAAEDRAAEAPAGGRPGSNGSRPAAAAPSIGELEAKYSLYCKAMRLLLKEGRSMDAIRRTVCWSRLEQLHLCLPSRYKSPDYLYAVLKRDLS